MAEEEGKQQLQWLESIGKGADMYIAWPDSVHVLSAERMFEDEWKWEVSVHVGAKPVLATGSSGSLEEAQHAAEEAFAARREHR